jgi:hypothetical protein
MAISTPAEGAEAAGDSAISEGQKKRIVVVGLGMVGIAFV